MRGCESFGKAVCKSSMKEPLFGGVVPLKAATVNQYCLLALKEEASCLTSSWPSSLPHCLLPNCLPNTALPIKPIWFCQRMLGKAGRYIKNGRRWHFRRAACCVTAAQIWPWPFGVRGQATHPPMRYRESRCQRSYPDGALRVFIFTLSGPKNILLGCIYNTLIPFMLMI